MIGSLTVLPALLSKLGDRVEKGRIPLLGRLRSRTGESRIWSRILTPVLRRPLSVRDDRDRGARRDGDPNAPTAHRSIESAVTAAPTPHGADAKSSPGRVPGAVEPGRGRGQDGDYTAAFRTAVHALAAKAAAADLGYGAVQVDANASRTVGADLDPAARQRCRQHLEQRAADAAWRAAPANDRPTARRELRGDRSDRRVLRLEPDDQELAPARVRLRAHARVRCS